MDAQQYGCLVMVLAGVPDPRHARGRWHAWPLILTLISAALPSPQAESGKVG